MRLVECLPPVLGVVVPVAEWHVLLVILLMPTLQLVQVRTVALVTIFVLLRHLFLHLFLQDVLHVRCIVIVVIDHAVQPSVCVAPFGAVVPRFLVPTTAIVYLQHVDQSVSVVGYVILCLSVHVLPVFLALR